MEEAHDLGPDELLICFVVDGEKNTSRLFDHCKDHKTCEDVVFKTVECTAPPVMTPHTLCLESFLRIKND